MLSQCSRLNYKKSTLNRDFISDNQIRKLLVQVNAGWFINRDMCAAICNRSVVPIVTAVECQTTDDKCIYVYVYYCSTSSYGMCIYCITMCTIACLSLSLPPQQFLCLHMCICVRKLAISFDFSSWMNECTFLINGLILLELFAFILLWFLSMLLCYCVISFSIFRWSHANAFWHEWCNAHKWHECAVIKVCLLKNAFHILYWGIYPIRVCATGPIRASCSILIDNIWLFIHLTVAVWLLTGIQLQFHPHTASLSSLSILFFFFFRCSFWWCCSVVWEKLKNMPWCLSQLSWKLSNDCIEKWVNWAVAVTMHVRLWRIRAFLFTKLIASLWYRVPCCIANSTSCKINKQMQT